MARTSGATSGATAASGSSTRSSGSSRRRKEVTGTGSRLSPSGAVDDSEHELRESPDLERDAEVAARIYAWFEAASLAR